jgi:hypothetical protein
MTCKFPKAYAVVFERRKGVAYPITLGAELPVYWSRRVAKERAAEFGGFVVPVVVRSEKR